MTFFGSGGDGVTFFGSGGDVVPFFGSGGDGLCLLISGGDGVLLLGSSFWHGLRFKRNSGVGGLLRAYMAYMALRG